MQTSKSKKSSGRNRVLVSLGLVAAFVTMAGLLVPNYRENITANASAQNTREVEVKMLSASSVMGVLADEVSLAIMGAADFDATTVDASSIVFAGAVVLLDAAGNHRVSFEDINHDGFTDLIIRINRRSLHVGPRPIKAEFSARTTSGESLIGTECAQASGIPCGGELIDRGNQQQVEATSPSTPNVIIFSENFDAAVPPELPPGWVTNFLAGAADCTGSGMCPLGSFWQTTATNPFSPPNAVFHNDPTCVTNNLLDSPVIPISPAASQLSFKNAFNLEGTFDGAVIEISINGGAFTDIITAGGSFLNGGYNGTISNAFFSPIAGRQAWTGLSGGSVSTPAYINTVVNLPAAAQGQPVKLRWRCASDCNGTAAGTSGQWIDDVTIDDSPGGCTINCPANVTTTNTLSQCGTTVTYPPPTTSGSCGTVTCAPSSGSFFPVGLTVVSCTTSAGPSCTFNVTVNDTEPPTITCPASFARSTDPGQCTAVATYPAPTVNDNCPGSAAPSCNPPSGSSFPKGVTAVNCNVSDAAGNPAACSFNVTVNDTQAPTLTCPANVTRSTDPNQCAATVAYPAPTVNDNCPGSAAPSCNPPPGSSFPKGVTAVNCNVTDAAGNPAACSFNVTVNDTQAPSITCPPNQSATSSVPTVVNYPAPTTSDNCPGVTSSCAPPSGSVFAVGTTTVTCTATDTAANSASCNFTVTVAACTITCPLDVAAATGPSSTRCGNNVTYPPPTVAGGCGAAVCTPASGSFFPVGSSTVTCTIPTGLTCSFAITVIDDAPPSITCPNTVTALAAPGQSSAVVNYPAAVATDNCAVASLQCSPPTGARFPVGSSVVTCTATDGFGNSAGCMFTVAVFDQEAPAIICPANVAVGVQPGQTSAVVSYPSPTVTDNGSGVMVVCSPASGTSFPLGVTTVTCIATDAAGNKSSCSFTASVGGPLAKVIIPSNKPEVEFGNPSPVSPTRKPLKERKNPCQLFSIQNIGFAPLVLTFDSITRTGSDVDSRKITNQDDTRYFSLSLVGANGSTTTIEPDGVVTIQVGATQQFCLRFSAVIPALAGKATGVAAANALPDTVTSSVNFIQNGGSLLSVKALSHIDTGVIFINPTNPRKPASTAFTRSGNDLTVSYALYDPNLNVSRAKYEFLNSSGQVVGSAFEIDLSEQLRALNLVRGQSFAVEQRFTGAKDHPDIVGVRVTVFDGESSVTDSASAASVTTASVKLFDRTGDATFYWPVARHNTTLQ